MSKFSAIMALGMIGLVVMSALAIGVEAASAQVGIAATLGTHEGPAPNSGDGIPDGSGMDDPANGNPDANSPGPAPNSGDGIPDGSGF